MWMGPGWLAEGVIDGDVVTERRATDVIRHMIVS